MAPPTPRRRTRANNTSLHKRGTSSKGKLENLDQIINQRGTSGPVSSAPNTSRADATASTCSLLEELPPEVVNHILSYLVHPRSRLPGLTEQQSALRDARRQREVKLTEDLRSPPDTDRFAADLFTWTTIPHPLNALGATSNRCREFVESYCEHLVKGYNIFKLPFARVEEHGHGSVYPSLSSIVYRRLWLQTAPRHCLFCGVFMSQYPYRGFIRLLLSCADCFYAQTLSLYEVQHQYHIINPAILTRYGVSGTINYEWILRIDVEALALRLYGTRAFHDTLSQGLEAGCSIPNCGFAPNLLTISRPPPGRRLPAHVSPASPRRSRRRGA